MKRTTLKRTKGINRVSLRKILQMQAETPIRLELCKRVQGFPILGKHTYEFHGKPYEVTTVQCYNGICEVCGMRCEYLEPHEKRQRSLGGKLSLDNTIMVCRVCHRKEQNDEPRWSKKDAV